MIPLALDLFRSVREPGHECAFLVLLAFLGSFAFIRTSARLMRSPRVPWWPGSVEAGDLHIHHLVWGISLLLISGFAAFVSDLYSPWWQITSIGFGIGAGLTLDEFALWLRLEDVYWSAEGRQSIDAVIMAALLASLVVVGVRPFDVGDTGSVLGTVGVVTADVILAAMTFLKGRTLLGSVSLFVPVVGLVGASRLAKPNSPWSHRRYTGSRADKLERSHRRYAASTRANVLGRRLRDAIGGAPSDRG
ncbi:MAG: hypothetical protein M3Z33_06990 [Actinomycetota bacterium]|nr:hypothetical protein [Actinomycetota bacterium]